MDADLEAQKDQLTPAQREEVQEYFVRRYIAARRFAQPERRATMIARLPLEERMPIVQTVHRWPQAWRREASLVRGRQISPTPL